MGRYVHSICCVKWFLSARASELDTETLKSTTKGTKLSFMPSSDFFVCRCWSGLSFFLFPQPPRPQNSSRRRKKWDEKAKALADQWSMTQLWTSPPSNQIVRLQGAEVPQSCPGPLGVTDQLWGVNAHFSQLSRTCDGGKGIRRSTGVTTLANIRVFETLNCVINGKANFLSPNTPVSRHPFVS